MGLSLSPAQLRRVRLIADKHFPGIIEGDPDSFADSCLMTMHSIVAEVQRSVLASEIGPRDLPHAGRALGHMMSLVCGEASGRPQYTEIKMVVVGADGQPFDPKEIPQVAK